MTALLSEQILLLLEQAGQLYNRLIFLVSPSAKGKTAVLHAIAQQEGYPYINLNLALSRKLLDLTEQQRILQLLPLLAEIVTSQQSSVVLLDNIELIFDPSLRQIPLQLLQRISRDKTVMVGWNGSVEHDHLVYATPDHPEYQRYPAQGLLIVSLS